MNDQKTQNPDPLIDQVRGTRQRLIEEHGDLRGWVDHLQQMQRQHPEKLVPQSLKSGARRAAR